LRLSDLADGEVEAPALEAERAVITVAFFSDACHVRLLLRKRPVDALLAEIWRKSVSATKRARTTLST
jgi:hypothetical protein